MVHLTRIYTRTGDGGRTRLADRSEVAKTDPRLEAYGTVDEANCLLGMALAAPDVPADLAVVLRAVQNDLFDVGADLATPSQDAGGPVPLRVSQAAVERVEGWCDRFNEPLPPLRSFVLPGGVPTSVYLHLARTVLRRAERAAWALATPDLPDGGVHAVALRYLNRASDLMFILARYANHKAGVADVLWAPGGGDSAEIPDPSAPQGIR